jgi:hypothetical protein
VFLIQACFSNELNWNQNARLAATFAFVEPGTAETGTFRIDNFYRNKTRGLTTGDWATSEHHFYSNKAPGASMLGVFPYYLVFYGERLLGMEPQSKVWVRQNSWLVNLLVSVMWNAIAAAFLFAALKKIGQTSRDAMIGALLYSFGTLVFPFSGSVWGHTTAAAFFVLSVFFWLDATAMPETRSANSCNPACASALCGFFAGCAVLTEYLAGPGLLFIGGTFVLKKERWRLISYFTMGAAIPVSILLLYQQLYFGSFLTTATSLSNPILHSQFEALSLFALAMLLFSVYRGMIPYMPIIAMCVIGAGEMIRRQNHRELAWLCVFTATAVLVVVSSFHVWWGGACSGPRYLIVILPFLVFILPPFSSLPRPFAIIYSIAGLISVLNMWIIASYSVNSPDEVANPLYGQMYEKFWTGRVSAQTLEMFFGWEGRSPVLVMMGAFLIFAAALLMAATAADNGSGLKLFPSGLNQKRA